MQIVNEESDADIDVFGVWYINVRPKYETLNKLHKKKHGTNINSKVLDSQMPLTVLTRALRTSVKFIAREYFTKQSGILPGLVNMSTILFQVCFVCLLFVCFMVLFTYNDDKRVVCVRVCVRTCVQPIVCSTSATGR